MANLFLGNTFQSPPKADGTVNAGGLVHFYEPGTSTRKDTYSDNALTTPNANPLVLGPDGRGVAFLKGKYKVRLETSDGVLIKELDNVNDMNLLTDADRYNKVVNGDFEQATVSSTLPDEWTITLYTDGTAALDSTDRHSGLKSLKFTSTGTGGGYAVTDNFISVSPDIPLNIGVSLRSSDAGVRNLVEVLWYTSAQVLDSTTTLYDDSTTNPTSWTAKSFFVNPPATAYYAKLRITGCHSSDATTGSTWFDNARVVQLDLAGAAPVDVRLYGAVGDGITDDTTALQAAFTAGGVILLPAGKTFLTTKLNGQSNTTIIGYGATLKLKNSTNDTILEFDARSNIRVYGVTFDGNRANQSVFGPLLGMYFQDCTDFVVKDCVAHSVYGIGFGHNCCQRGFFINNYAYNCTDNGVDFNGDYHTIARTNQGNKHIVIDGNLVQACGADGIFVGHDTNEAITITNNICTGNTRHAIHLGESSAYAGAEVNWRNNIVEGNVCSGNTGGGIVGWCIKHSQFKNNNCVDNGTYGIRLSRTDAAQPASTHNLVEGNKAGNITGTQQYGIILEGGEDNNIVTNNQIFSNTTTALSKTGANTSVEDNWFDGVFQKLSGSYTTPSVAASGVDATAISFTSVPFAVAPVIKVCIGDTTGTERFIVHYSSLTNTGATLRTVNLDGALAGTAVVSWAVVRGGF